MEKQQVIYSMTYVVCDVVVSVVWYKHKKGG
jgi:hypothetical protein